MTDHDPLDDLARSLRAGAGAELREEAEIAEQETHRGRLRRRTLGDVAREAVGRGDRVTLFLPDRTLTGEAVYAGEDYLTVRTPHEEVDVRLSRASFTVTRRPSGGHLSRGGSATLKARLGEYEQSGETVDLVVPDLDRTITAVVRVVAADHLMAVEPDGTEIYLPLGQVALVVRPAPPG
jgi:hypothetical protein